SASIRSRKTAMILCSPAGRYWNCTVTPPPQTMPRLAASPRVKRNCRRASPPRSSSSAARRWHSNSTFPPPMVPVIPPPGNTAIMAPAPRGVEPSEAAMLTSSTGRPSSRAWTISLKNSRISADSSVHSAQDQDQYRHAAVQIFCRRVKPAAQRAPPGQIHLNQAVLLFQHPVEEHPRQQRADGTGVDGADIHPAGDDALDAQPHGQAHDAD
ncbi:DUF3021 domain-containing protein, partial [Dysosmobacter welbionis]